MLRSEFDLHQDNHTKAWYLVIASGTAFGLGVDLIACLFTTILTFCLIILNSGKELLNKDNEEY